MIILPIVQFDRGEPQYFLFHILLLLLLLHFLFVSPQKFQSRQKSCPQSELLTICISFRPLSPQSVSTPKTILSKATLVCLLLLFYVQTRHSHLTIHCCTNLTFLFIIMSNIRNRNRERNAKDGAMRDSAKQKQATMQHIE